MPLFGELFISEVLGKPILDPTGDELGTIKDAVLVKGEPLPKLDALIVGRKKDHYRVQWESMNLFNKRIISTTLNIKNAAPYDMEAGEDLLALRDILDKQIVDANGAKVVRVNDIKLEGYQTDAVLTAVDVGMRGILRRMGLERRGESIMKFFRSSLPSHLISWNYMQPIQPKLSTIGLTVSRQMVEELHPADLADLLSQVSPVEGLEFIQNLDPETAAEAISELEMDTQATIIKDMPAETAADIIEEMSPDAAADLISELPDDLASDLLRKIEDEEAEDIQELLGHESDTAGGLMTTEYINYPPGMTVAEAMLRFRKDAPEIESVYYIYIIDEEERLVGVLSLKDMLLSESTTTLGSIMETNIKSVRPEADEMEVAAVISKYDLFALPVVDCDTCLIGIITVDDILDLLLPKQARKKRRSV
jgi:CBS domain-containing protein